eukprot:GHVU01225395.1.p2 GENE.GHVU01225395.1~~GHVU01225395.1.p2  ORF type:complete len:153 (-),score=5.07 GHVU01225395.1:141-599(-)
MPISRRGSREVRGNLTRALMKECHLKYSASIVSRATMFWRANMVPTTVSGRTYELRKTVTMTISGLGPSHQYHSLFRASRIATGMGAKHPSSRMITLAQQHWYRQKGNWKEVTQKSQLIPQTAIIYNSIGLKMNGFSAFAAIAAIAATSLVA